MMVHHLNLKNLFPRFSIHLGGAARHAASAMPQLRRSLVEEQDKDVRWHVAGALGTRRRSAVE